MTNAKKKCTVIFLLFNAARVVTRYVSYFSSFLWDTLPTKPRLQVFSIWWQQLF